MDCFETEGNVPDLVASRVPEKGGWLRGVNGL